MTQQGRGDDHVGPELAEQLREAGLAWEPAVGDWAEEPSGQEARVVASVYPASKRAGPGVRMWNDRHWDIDEFDAADCLWLPSVGQMLGEIARRRLLGLWLHGYPGHGVYWWATRASEAPDLAAVVGCTLLAVLRAEKAG